MSNQADYPFFFTWTAQNEARPVELAGGEGVHYFTKDGGRWLDLAAFSYQVNLGHGHPRMVAAIQRQAAELCVTTPSGVFEAKTALARRLLELAPPGFTKVFFALGGAEANENALKIARLVTGRYKLVSRYRSYHGATMGALTLSGDWRRPPLEPGIPGVTHVLDCYCDRCPFGKTVDACGRECAGQLDEVLGLERGVGAVILEPVPGANGVLVPPPDYWPRVREACDRHGALLIADEVLTGFGRTGKMFAVEHWDVVPDMITLAKGLTGGYAPLGAVLVHERVARHFDDHTLVAGLTNYAHPLGCAAGLEALDVYRDEGLVENAAALGPVLLDGLGAIRARLGERAVAHRGLGLLGALELSADRPAWGRVRDALEARRVNVHLYPGAGNLVVSPPLGITKQQLSEGLALVGDALAEALA